MLFEFIATISVGLGTAGLILGINYIVRWVTGTSFPKIFMPTCAGLAMITFTIWSEYNWFPRQVLGLGEGTVVATQVDKKQAWRPWTFAKPVTTRFIALDGLNTVVKDDIIVTEIYLMARWQQSYVIPAAFDCRDMKRADFLTGLEDDLDAQLATADWLQLTADDPVLMAACGIIR